MWYENQKNYLEKLEAAKRAVSDLEGAAKAAGDEIGETTARVVRLRIEATIKRNVVRAAKG